ncbi:MAG: hypothetical protein HY537_17330 [Deltaproteobacteria bacterium]|nr:hypothetical protein [Deltaproteobacteria bacterium]
MLARLLLLLTPSALWAEGSYLIIDNKPTAATGTLEIKATVATKVSLSISDTATNDLVKPTGMINFGSVDSDGTAGTVPGIPVSPGKALYEADFIFSATKSGAGNVSVTAERSVPGTFNANDGVLIADDNGSLQPLPASGGAITVISNRTEGDFTKRLGIMIYSTDSGTLNSTLKFTLSAL